MSIPSRSTLLSPENGEQQHMVLGMVGFFCSFDTGGRSSLDVVANICGMASYEFKTDTMCEKHQFAFSFINAGKNWTL